MGGLLWRISQDLTFRLCRHCCPESVGMGGVEGVDQEVLRGRLFVFFSLNAAFVFF